MQPAPSGSASVSVEPKPGPCERRGMRAHVTDIGQLPWATTTCAYCRDDELLLTGGTATATANATATFGVPRGADCLGPCGVRGR